MEEDDLVMILVQAETFQLPVLMECVMDSQNYRPVTPQALQILVQIFQELLPQVDFLL